MGWHPQERAALADALAAAGPGAPTLCEGWLTQHLAAHVVLRERAILSVAGIVLSPLADRLDREIERLAAASSDAAGYASLVASVRAGPPRWHPMHWAPDAVQLVELFVHGEDVRRGESQVGPRVLPAGEQAALWRMLRGMRRFLYRPADVEVTLADAGGRRLVVPGAGPGVVITGAPAELVLHAYGRGSRAHVELHGAPEALEALARTHPAPEAR